MPPRYAYSRHAYLRVNSVIDKGSGRLCLGSAKERCHKTVIRAQKAFPFHLSRRWVETPKSFWVSYSFQIFFLSRVRSVILHMFQLLLWHFLVFNEFTSWDYFDYWPGYKRECYMSLGLSYSRIIGNCMVWPLSVDKLRDNTCLRMSKYGSLRKQQQNLFFHPDALKKHCEKGMLVLLNEYRVLQSEIMFWSFSLYFFNSMEALLGKVLL